LQVRTPWPPASLSFVVRRRIDTAMKVLLYGLFLTVCLILCGCATCKRAAPIFDVSSGPNFRTVSITANVDGSGRFIFTGGSVHYEHNFWSRPTEVTFNGEAWRDLDRTPSGWRDLSRLDLSRAWIVKRRGRDIVALEHTVGGFDLYFCDSPNGSADYAVTIAIPERD
jgi:hypothetical protein